MRNCIVAGCKSEWYPGTKILFHKFPTDKGRKKLWLDKVPLRGKPTENAVICSLHFTKEDYMSEKRLKSTACPFYLTKYCDPIREIEEDIESGISINLVRKDEEPEDHSIENDCKAFATKAVEFVEMTNDELPNEELPNEFGTIIDPPLCNGSWKLSTKAAVLQSSFTVIPREDTTQNQFQLFTALTQNEVKTRNERIPQGDTTQNQSQLFMALTQNEVKTRNDRGNDVQELYNEFRDCRDASVSAKMKSPRETQLTRKIKTLNQKLVRQRSRIKKMKAIIDELRHYTHKSEIENILEGNFAKLCRRINMKPNLPAKYSDRVMMFAKSVHFHSAKAYEYIKQYIDLPHKSTLVRKTSDE